MAIEKLAGMKNGNTILRIFLLFVAGCSSIHVVPEELKDRVNYHVPFVKLLENPLEHKGEVLVIGGQILSAKRLERATQLELLQLPLNRHLKPVKSLQRSQGRFLAFQEKFLDPATVPPGTRVTVVGEVSGKMTLPLDETTYDFPTLTIKHLTIWPSFPPGPYPYVSPHWRPYKRGKGMGVGKRASTSDGWRPQTLADVDSVRREILFS